MVPKRGEKREKYAGLGAKHEKRATIQTMKRMD